MKITGILALLVAALLVFACYNDKEELLYPSVSGAGCDTTNVTFSKTIVPLLSNNCYGCHNNASAASFGNNIRLEDYNDVVTSLDRLYNAVSWNYGYSQMPKNGNKLSDCQRREIFLWRQLGAPK
jgi:hypothetical protein